MQVTYNHQQDRSSNRKAFLQECKRRFFFYPTLFIASLALAIYLEFLV